MGYVRFTEEKSEGKQAPWMIHIPHSSPSDALDARHVLGMFAADSNLRRTVFRIQKNDIHPERKTGKRIMGGPPVANSLQKKQLHFLYFTTLCTQHSPQHTHPLHVGHVVQSCTQRGYFLYLSVMRQREKRRDLFSCVT